MFNPAVGVQCRNSALYAESVSSFSAAYALRQTQRFTHNAGMELGEALRKRRKLLKMTLEEVGLQAGIDSGNLSRIERGRQGANPELLKAIVRALRLETVSQLFTTPGAISSEAWALRNMIVHGHGEIALPEARLRKVLTEMKLLPEEIDRIVGEASEASTRNKRVLEQFAQMGLPANAASEAQTAHIPVAPKVASNESDRRVRQEPLAKPDERKTAYVYDPDKPNKGHGPEHEEREK